MKCKKCLDKDLEITILKKKIRIMETELKELHKMLSTYSKNKKVNLHIKGCKEMHIL